MFPLLTQVSGLTALCSRKAVPPRWGYDCVVVYRAATSGLVDGTLLPQSRAAPLGLRLRRSLPRRFPAAWFRFPSLPFPFFPFPLTS